MSKHQKNLRDKIQQTQDNNKRTALKQLRNKVQRDIKKIIKKEENNKILEHIQEIENSKNDSRRMFKATKLIQRKNNNNVCIKTCDGKIVNSTNQKLEIITKYFESVFNPDDIGEFPHIPPQKLNEPFTSEEIRKAIKSLKNNKSAGIDKLKAEHLKCAPVEINQIIADLLNNICETGEYPKEISIGLLTPLQKPGKEKGPPQNLRPIILLSVLRKIIAICLIRRISDRVFSEIIPVTQAAYRPGRSASELIFSFKLLAEKAITAENYDIHLLMLDMSKAFDNIRRETLIEDLKSVLNCDELFLVNILLKDIQLSIKLKNKVGEFFPSTIGSPQGDGASAIFFIISLANSKKVEPGCVFDCNNNLHFLLEQQFADDISYASTSEEEISRIEKETSADLKSRNLLINKSKTEKYTITRNGNETWRKCKLVGSLLSTEEDIKRRKSLANHAYCAYKTVFQSKKISQHIKIRLFQALVGSIFLYNSETWGLTKSQEYEIDTFQRRLLRKLLSIRYTAGNWCSNEDLYKKTKLQPWSKIIKRRRWSFFGHVCRLPDEAPAKRALKEANRRVKHPRGKQKTTYLSTIKKDLKEKNIITIQHAIETSQNRKEWKDLNCG